MVEAWSWLDILLGEAGLSLVLVTPMSDICMKQCAPRLIFVCYKRSISCVRSAGFESSRELHDSQVQILRNRKISGRIASAFIGGFLRSEIDAKMVLDLQCTPSHDCVIRRRVGATHASPEGRISEHGRQLKIDIEAGEEGNNRCPDGESLDL